MKLEVIRKIFNQNNTIGELYIDGQFFCYTLEDVIREVKIKDETAIPYGTYKVILSLSNRFKRILPEILNVPGFVGIRMHNGNTETDTSGCILLGFQTGNKKIWESVKATDALVQKLTGVTDIELILKPFADSTV